MNNNSKLILFFVYAFFLFSQKDSIVIDVIYNEPFSKVRQFEIEFLKEITLIYNAKHPRPFKLNFIPVQGSSGVYIYIRLPENQSNFICGLTSATIDKTTTNYSYSLPYLPVRDAIIGKINQTEPIVKSRYYSISHMDSPYYNPMVDSLQKSYLFKITKTKSYNESKDLFFANHVEFYIGDSIDTWLNKNLKVMMYINNDIAYFGILFPPHTTLKEKFDSVINYYTKSASFYKLLKKHFGKDLKEYYNQTMFK